MQSSVDGKTESVSVVPNKLKGNCEALLLIVSALDGDTGRTDLSSAAGLTFKLASLGEWSYLAMPMSYKLLVHLMIVTLFIFDPAGVPR